MPTFTDEDGAIVREPDITINGHPLDLGQAMTLRVALSQFMMELADDDYAKELGPIAEGYKARATEIMKLMVSA